MWNLIKNKVNFVIDMQVGKMWPLASQNDPQSKKMSYVNDRFFMYNSAGYQMIGHKVPSTKRLSKNDTDDSSKTEKTTELENKTLEEENQKESVAKQIARGGPYKVIMGDDLGCNQFAYLSARFDFLNIPILSEYKIKLFTQAEAIYYPCEPVINNPNQSLKEKFMDNLRVSCGVGISYPLTNLINVALYYNAANFNSKRGDLENSGAINLSFNFF